MSKKSAAKTPVTTAAPSAPKRRMGSAKPAPAPAAQPAEPTGPTKEEQDRSAAFFAANTKPAKGAAKAKTEAKPKGDAAPKAEKPKKVVVNFTPRVAAKGATVHAIELTARPTSGTRLFAHTHAALTMFGMLADGCPAVPEKHLLAVMGQRAVSYHKKCNNFESVKDHMIRLTGPGLNFFRARMGEGKVDGGLANDFLSVFLDGKAPTSTGVDDGKVYVAVKL